MELRQLRHFVEIVRCASFGQAAERLHITQPALSKSIRNLERYLDVRLLERHASGVVPTEYGRVLLEYATVVSTEVERAVLRVREMKGTGRGTIRIGAGSTLLQYFLPRAVRRFLKSGECDNISVRQGLKDGLFTLLRRGEIDLVVSSVDLESGDPELTQEKLLDDRLAVVAARGHPLVGRSMATIDELASYRWVIPDNSEPETARLAQAFRAGGHPPPRTAIQTGSSIFMAAVLRDTDYLSYLPRALLAMDPEYSDLAPVETPVLWPNVTVGVTYRRRQVMLPPVRRFIAELKSVAADVGATLDPAPPVRAERRASTVA
jgi:DNA-binding transcriptional LysR family regulator